MFAALAACLLIGSAASATSLPTATTCLFPGFRRYGQQQAHTLRNLLQSESDRFAVTIIVEGRLPDPILDEADFQRVNTVNTKNECFAELGPLAAKFGLEAKLNGSVLLINKSYVGGKNIPPCVTLKECRQAVHQMLLGLDRLVPGLGPGKSIGDPSYTATQELADSLSDADWQRLSSSSGYPVREMSPEQQKLITKWRVSLEFGDVIQSFRWTENRLDNLINQAPVIKYVDATAIAKSLPAGKYLVCDLTKLKTANHFVLLDHFDPTKDASSGSSVSVADSSQGIVIFRAGAPIVNGTVLKPEPSPASDVAAPAVKLPEVKSDNPDLTKKLDEVLNEINGRAEQKVSYVAYEDISDKRITILGEKYSDASAIVLSIADLCGFSQASAKEGREYTIRPPLIRNLDPSKLSDGFMTVLPKPLLRAWAEAVVTEQAPQARNASTPPVLQKKKKRILRSTAAKIL